MSGSQIGEGFAGTGAEAAHVTVVLGERGGPVETAWVTALATPSAGHIPLVVELQPGLLVKPFTLLVPKATVTGTGHARLVWGPAQAGVAAGVADAVAEGEIDHGRADRLLVIATVWVDPAAADAAAVFANNRAAALDAIRSSATGGPSVDEVLAARHEAWNPWYRPGT